MISECERKQRPAQKSAVPEPLKNHFDARIPRGIADQIARAWPEFDADAFVADAVTGYEALELMDRGRHFARALRRHLPDDYPEAVRILVASAGERPTSGGGDGGMASFFYLPHVNLVAEFGLEHFRESLEALYVFTQLFTAEFSIRPFIERFENETLALLREWARDPNHHVRRLVSEGTRTRLPWAGQLRRFREDPSPVLELLELLKDDPELYVRRSVANNLNDIGKDHPEVLVGVARRWMKGAGKDRQALVRHALRSLVKQGHPGALAILGFGQEAAVVVENANITPERVPLGGETNVSFTIRSTAPEPQPVLVDLRVHYVKANGSASPKVFKLKVLELAAGEVTECRKKLSLADLSTRRHYPGEHRVEALINGRAVPLGSFVVTP